MKCDARATHYGIQGGRYTYECTVCGNTNEREFSAAAPICAYKSRGGKYRMSLKLEPTGFQIHETENGSTYRRQYFTHEKDAREQLARNVVLAAINGIKYQPV